MGSFACFVEHGRVDRGQLSENLLVNPVEDRADLGGGWISGRIGRWDATAAEGLPEGGRDELLVGVLRAAKSSHLSGRTGERPAAFAVGYYRDCCSFVPVRALWTLARGRPGSGIVAKSGRL